METCDVKRFESIESVILVRVGVRVRVCVPPFFSFEVVLLSLRGRPSEQRGRASEVGLLGRNVRQCNLSIRLQFQR